MSDRAPRKSLHLRATPAQHRALRQAAVSSGRTMTAFVLDSACATAYQRLAGQPDVPMLDADWEHVLGLLGRVGADRDRLRALLGRPA
jgi:uncharacterized protein (DUF1778 family)